MALINFPSELFVTRSDLSLQHPGQVVLRSVYGAGSQVLGRGPGYERGGSSRLHPGPWGRFPDSGSHGRRSGRFLQVVLQHP